MSTDQAVKEQMRQFVQGAMKPWYWRLWIRTRGVRRVLRIGDYEFTTYRLGDDIYVASCTASVQ